MAQTRPLGQAVKTPPFHGGNMGSIPVGVTKKEEHTQTSVFFVWEAFAFSNAVRQKDFCEKWACPFV